MSDKQVIKAGREAVTTVERNYRNEVRANRAYRAERAKGIFTGVLTFIVLVLLIVNIYKVSMGKKQISFSSMFQFFSTFEESFVIPDLSLIIKGFTIQKEWAILDGLRIFINGLGTILGVVAYAISCLVYTISFASKFLIYILG